MFCVIGDIHGNSEKLNSLVNSIHAEYGKIDLYHLGDIIDRGPDSKGVIDLCIQHNIQGILGNHEEWFKLLIDTNVFDDFALLPIVGGNATLKSYGVKNVDSLYDSNPNSFIPSKHKEYISSLLPYRFVNGCLLTHSGFNQKLRDAIPANVDIMTGIKDSLEKNQIVLRWSDVAPAFLPFLQFRGHVPHKAPAIYNNCVSLDTGCSTLNPKQLSCCVVPSMHGLLLRPKDLKFYSV